MYPFKHSYTSYHNESYMERFGVPIKRTLNFSNKECYHDRTIVRNNSTGCSCKSMSSNDSNKVPSNWNPRLQIGREKV